MHYVFLQFLVQDNDRITIDSEKNNIDLDVPFKELAERRANYEKRPYKVNSGALYRYIKTVKSASEGCVTDE